ncbi:class I SAM-dependent methyltransferase [Aliiroseovarius sp. S1339]|uniref:class I SAM-dependent methyltransferase n=1 Tax=Aliiroseovarius sp. S1339 TaxID=2936990 RepID=UPI0020BDFD0C|nr:class I SAM-dependent methyltransferase [Aliiroseovarius sp. S1339]MCK8464410.1 class I SAM-dependent methyltransferase [Aliiroseovarius sp. S1339]
MELNFADFADNKPHLRDRMDERSKRIVVENLDAFQNKSVLDIAANNGRWTYAAALAGASHVTSIEGRAERVADAKDFLTKHGCIDKVSLNTGDMYDFLFENKGKNFNTVLCLGVYYHVMDHSLFLKMMTQLDPQTIIIDSGFVRSFRSQVHVQYEDPSLHLNALANYEGQKYEPVGFISLGLMIQLAWNLGYSCRPVVWDPKDVGNKNAVHDYMIGKRYTLRLEKMDGHYDADWKTHWQKALVALDPSFENLFDKETHDPASDERSRYPQRHFPFTFL